MNKFEEMIEERKKNTSLINKIHLKIMEYKYNRLLDKTMLDATKIAFESQIYELNKDYLDAKNNKKKMETSKFLMYLIVVNCSIIEAYSMWAMVYFADLSSLSTLMCAVITESISFAVYCAKAYFGKRGEVDTELERERIEMEREQMLISTLPEDNSEEEIFEEDHLNDLLNNAQNSFSTVNYKDDSVG